VQHSTALAMTTSLAATWKIPAATTFGQSAVLLDMTRLGSPTSATLVVVYTNHASAANTNQIGLVLSSTPQASGTTVTSVASSVVTLVNSSAFPQVIEKELTVSELGTTKQWVQLALNLDNASRGPSVRSCTLILYYQ
jgi:hypothetical protein